VWKQGPTVVNAKILELVEAHRPTRAELKATVSPQPVIKDGKLDVQPNDTYDAPDGREGLTLLPSQQRAVIRVLVTSLRANKNIDPGVVAALQEYDEELLTNGTRPALGTLNQMHQIVREEYLGLRKEKFFDTQRGLRRSFLSFFANHKQIKTHFPLDAVREVMYRAATVDFSSIDVSLAKEAGQDLSNAVRDALEAEAVTEDYAKVTNRVVENIRRITETPPPASDRPAKIDGEESFLDPPEVSWFKRAYIFGRGFADASLSRIASAATLIAFPESKIGKALIQALKAFVASLSGSDDESG
jgi:hypothetical protein